MSNFLHHKYVEAYYYASSIAPKIVTYRRVLQDFNIGDLKGQPPYCYCHNSPFKYNSAGHVITVDLSTIDNDNLRKILVKGSKYRESKFISWNYNFKLLMDSVEDYARYGQNEKKTFSLKFIDSNSNQKTQKVNEHKSNICIQ